MLKIHKNLSQSSVLPKWIAYYFVPWEIMKVFSTHFIYFLINYIFVNSLWSLGHSLWIMQFHKCHKYFENSSPPRKRGEFWLPLINCFPSEPWTDVKVIIWGAHWSGYSWKVSSSKTRLLKVTGYWTSIQMVDVGFGNIVSFYISRDLKKCHLIRNRAKCI